MDDNLQTTIPVTDRNRFPTSYNPSFIHVKPSKKNFVCDFAVNYKMVHPRKTGVNLLNEKQRITAEVYRDGTIGRNNIV